MAQIQVKASAAVLTSTYTCTRVHYVFFRMDNSISVDNPEYSKSVTDANVASKTLGFTFNLPNNAVITDAKLCATVTRPEEGSPKWSAMNGMFMSPSGGAMTWPVQISAIETLSSSARRYSATFEYQVYSSYHFHDGSDNYVRQWDEWETITLPDDPNMVTGKRLYRTFVRDHSSTLYIDDIYLLIDYEENGSGGSGGSGDSGGSGGYTPGMDIPEAGAGLEVIEAEDFHLTSVFEYEEVDKYYFTADNHTNPVHHEWEASTIAPSKDEKYVRFNLNLPRGAIVKSAYVQAALGTGKYPVSLLTVAGVSFDHGTAIKVPVNVPSGASYVDVAFVYVCDDSRFDPSSYSNWKTTDYWEYGVASENYHDIHYFVDTAECESVINVRDLHLVVEYTMPGASWSLADDTVEPGEALQVLLAEINEGYTYTVQATIGDYDSGEETFAPGAATASIDVPDTWLYAIPNFRAGEGTVTVREYLDGELVNETAKPFTLTCPESAKPYFEFAHTRRLLIVDGVTYPSLITNAYVQNKCGVQAVWEGVTAQFGASIVSSHINVGGYKGDAYNAENPADFQISSGLLPEAGKIPITLTVTDSRGLTLTAVQYIDVLAYAPPAIVSFDVWRVNKNGTADEQGEYVQYSFVTTHTDFGGNNQLSATLTVDGKTEENVRNTGWLLPSNRLTFVGANAYPVELTLKDTYETVTFGAAVIRPLTGTTVVIRPTRKGKRGLIIGDYDTTQEADWTLAALSFPEPDYEQKFVNVPGRKAGPLDMTAVLTDGVPTYGSRSLAARLELSEGTRDDRNTVLSRMINQLDGRRWEITLPDDPDRYVVGRVSVKTEYSDLAHAAVSVSAICEPWRYNKLVTEIAYSATVAEKEGEYTLPGLVLHPGNTPITYSGYGVISFAYREAVL